MGAQDTGNGLPAGAEEVLSGPYDPNAFSCEGQDYGYYADVARGCEIFHICLPIQDSEATVIEYAKWSFFCPSQTVFDQQSLTCNHPDNAFPCEESPPSTGLSSSGSSRRITEGSMLWNNN